MVFLYPPKHLSSTFVPAFLKLITVRRCRNLNLERHVKSKNAWYRRGAFADRYSGPVTAVTVPPGLVTYRGTPVRRKARNKRSRLRGQARRIALHAVRWIFTWYFYVYYVRVMIAIRSCAAKSISAAARWRNIKRREKTRRGAKF